MVHHIGQGGAECAKDDHIVPELFFRVSQRSNRHVVESAAADKSVAGEYTVGGASDLRQSIDQLVPAVSRSV